MILRFPRSIINSYPAISAFAAGLLAAIAHAPMFFTPGILGFSILAYVIHKSETIGSAIYRNFAFAFGYFGFGLYWIALGPSTYQDFLWVAVLSLIGMPIIFGIVTSLASVVAWKFRKNIHYILIYSVAWIFVEWLTTWIFTGLPWLLVGYSAGFSDVISQIASVCGVIGLSFLLFNISATFYYIWGDYEHSIKKDIKKDIFYASVILIGMFLFGIKRLEENPTKLFGAMIRIVQPSIAQTDKWVMKDFWRNLALQKRLSTMNTGIKPDIILWSEAAVTLPIQIKQVREYLNNVAKASDAILMTGAVSSMDNKIYTSVDAIDSSGKLLFEYHKQHLVPVGEYVPFKEFLPKNIKKVTDGFEDYTAGSGPKNFTIKLKKRSLKIRPLICYELVFPDEVGKGDDSDVIINFTNNAWYGDSMGPYQHFYMSKFRAIETGLPVVTVANNGISGLVDGAGRIIAKTQLNDIVALDILLPHKISSTLSSNYNMSYLWTLMALLLVGLFRNILKQRV